MRGRRIVGKRRRVSLLNKRFFSCALAVLVFISLSGAVYSFDAGLLTIRSTVTTPGQASAMALEGFFADMFSGIPGNVVVEEECGYCELDECVSCPYCEASCNKACDCEAAEDEALNCCDYYGTDECVCAEYDYYEEYAYDYTDVEDKNEGEYPNGDYPKEPEYETVKNEDDELKEDEDDEEDGDFEDDFDDAMHQDDNFNFDYFYGTYGNRDAAPVNPAPAPGLDYDDDDEYDYDEDYDESDYDDESTTVYDDYQNYTGGSSGNRYYGNYYYSHINYVPPSSSEYSEVEETPDENGEEYFMYCDVEIYSPVEEMDSSLEHEYEIILQYPNAPKYPYDEVID